jgi:hypothetical protein
MTRRLHSRWNISGRAVWAAGIAALLGASAVSADMSIAPVTSADVSLASGTSGFAADALADAVNEMRDAMQQAQDYDSGLDFAAPGSIAMLPDALRGTNHELLINTLTLLLGNTLYQAPEQTAGDAADPHQHFQFYTPDIYYYAKPGLDPGATYQMTGTIGDGTGHFTISGGDISSGSSETHHYLELGDNLDVNKDGTYTVDIGPTDSGDAKNYLDDSDANALLIRDMMDDPAAGPGNFDIKCIDNCPASILSGGFDIDDLKKQIEPLVGPGGGGFGDIDTDEVSKDLSNLNIAPLLSLLLKGLGSAIGPFNEMNMDLAKGAGIELDDNTMSDIKPEDFFGVGLPSARVSVGNFDLDSDEALVVKMPDVDSSFSSIELMNTFGSALPFTLDQTTLNHGQAFHSDDGYTYYVISDKNPGVANWLDSSAVGKGEIIQRFEGLPDDASDPKGQEVETQVVPVDDVDKYLPNDTPDVSPEEHAADMTERVLSQDSALDISRQPGDWLIQQGVLHSLEAEMGTDQFNEIFGEQPFTEMWLRLTPALSPDLSALTNDVLDNPADSLTALGDHLALAGKDLLLPLAWSVLRPVEDVLLTGLAANTAINDGSLEDLGSALWTGAQQLTTGFSDALFDPNTSIIAGILNARDDLATAVFDANDSFPSEAGPLATWEWDHMSELTSATSPDDLGSLLADLFNG